MVIFLFENSFFLIFLVSLKSDLIKFGMNAIISKI